MPKKMRRVLLIAALTAVMIFSVVLSSEAAAGNLLDIGDAAWAQQEITEMSSLEILQGYPDGNFLPYQSVTRLEAVAMLIRMMGLGGQAAAMEDSEVDYEVPYVPWGRGYLIMAVERGMLDKNYLNQLEPTGAATRAQVAALVCLALDLESTDSSLDFADAAQIPAGYQGYVAALVNQKLMQGLPGNVFEPNSVINRAQMAVLLSNLLNKDFANPYPNRHIAGTISDIEPISGTISLQGGTTKFLTAECRYYLDGKQVEAADIGIGDTVKLLLDDNGQVVFVRAVKAEPLQQVYIYVTGEIRSVDTDEITLENSYGYRSTYTLDDDVEVSDLNKGDQVKLKLNSSNCVIDIEVLESESLKGEIYNLDTSGTYGITIRNSDGDKFTYKVIDDVDVSDDLDFDELETGDEVRLTLDSDGWVDEIELLDSSDSELEGKIYDLDTSGTYGITIRNSDGDKFTYKVVDDVDVSDGLDFDELETGDEVRLELDSDDWVAEIELLDSSDSELEGKIYDLDTSGTYGITIRNSDGDKFTYKVVDDVDVSYGLDFDELETGDRVRLELDSDDWVDEIELLDSDQSTEEGVISGLRTGSNPRLWLTNSDDDDEELYDISDDVDCTRDGDSIDLDEIVIGSEAEIEIEDDEVVTIDITDDQDITIEGEVISVTVSSERVKIEQESGNRFTYYLEDGATLRDSDGDSIKLKDVDEGWDVELRLRDGKIRRLTEL